jgi:ABC-2 type transport system ATP-binding protein
MNSLQFAIQTFSLTKNFGKFEAIKNVNLQVKSGEIYCLIGPNGAGKTTLLKCIVGLYKPTTGAAEIMGIDIQKDPEGAKKCFGYVSDDPYEYPFLSGYEFLGLTGNLRGMEKVEIKDKIKQLSKLFPIENILGQQIAGFSRGSRQKLAFLSAMISNPPIIFIDEPIAGLDPESVEIFGKTINDYVRSGNTVFYISHNLMFAEKYSQKVGLMKDGNIVKQGNLADISSFGNLISSK